MELNSQSATMTFDCEIQGNSDVNPERFRIGMNPGELCSLFTLCTKDAERWQTDIEPFTTNIPPELLPQAELFALEIRTPQPNHLVWQRRWRP